MPDSAARVVAFHDEIDATLAQVATNTAAIAGNATSIASGATVAAANASAITALQAAQPEAVASTGAASTVAGTTTVDLTLARAMSADGMYTYSGTLRGVDPVTGALRNAYRIDVVVQRVSGTLGTPRGTATPLGAIVSGVLALTNPVTFGTDGSNRLVLRLAQILGAPNTSWDFTGGTVRVGS